MRVVNEDAHESKIAGDRDETVREMETQKLPGDGVAGMPITPGVVDMPDEVVKHGELDCSGGCTEIATRQNAIEASERGELNQHAENPDETEFAIADEVYHGGGS